MAQTRRSILKTSAALSAGCFLPACSKQAATSANEAPSSSDNPIDFSARLKSIEAQLLSAYPENATSYGVDSGDYAALRRQVSDRSPAGQEAIADGVKATLAELKAKDPETLSPDDALHLSVVETVFERTAEGFEFPYGDVALLNSLWSYRNAPYVVAQNTGAFTEIPWMLDANHKINSVDDADAYLERMEGYAGQLVGETERIVRDGKNGVVLPSFLMEKTLNQLRAVRDTGPKDWGIVTSLVERSAGIDGFAESDRATHRDKAIQIATDLIGPALQTQISALEALAPNTTTDAGVWKLPSGEAYYDWNLRASTTTNMSADEIHEMGISELAELQAQMEPILQSIGYTSGTVGERMKALGSDPRYAFAEGDAGRAEIMAFIEDKIEEIRGLMPEAFETLVPGFLEVTRIPPEIEAGAPGAYGGAGTVDGKEPGHFWINLRTPQLHNKFGLADLTYHEAIPGHVWQGEYTFKQPLIRSLLAFNAYSEGWALYAQQIAAELGVYEDFPVGRLGYLQSLAFRACRLVVDTGLHAKRWTREEAVNWFVENNGSNPEEVIGEVDRYCAWPGQACGYKVGHTAINRLRDKAKSSLGDAFDFRRFNDSLVLGGNVPMTVLEQIIDEYIAREKRT